VALSLLKSNPNARLAASMLPRRTDAAPLTAYIAEKFLACGIVMQARKGEAGACLGYARGVL
jgi:hypothetical protein